MTDLVNPSLTSDAGSFETAGTFAYAGAGPNGYVQPSGSPTKHATEGAITQGNFSAFSESHSGASLDATINAGEGFVFGSWVARDTNTTVTLAASTNNQTVYLGWDKSATDTVIIGLTGDFASEDPKMPIWDFDTDGSGVTSATDRRFIGKIVSIGDDDMLITWDSASGDIRWHDVGNSADRMALDRTTGDLTIEGNFTEGGAL